MKKRTFFGRSDFRPRESPEISVKLGEGGGGSRFFSELHTKCEVFAVFFFGGSPYLTSSTSDMQLWIP